MKLDIECVREVLLYLENNLIYDNESYSYEHLTITMTQVIEDITNQKGLDEKLLAYAIEKMCEVHIIEADIHKGAHHNILSCNIYDISFYGHQFIENIRPESIWEKTKGIATSIGNHSLKFIEDTAQKCAVTATATMVSSLCNSIKEQ